MNNKNRRKCVYFSFFFFTFNLSAIRNFLWPKFFVVMKIKVQPKIVNRVHVYVHILLAAYMIHDAF